MERCGCHCHSESRRGHRDRMRAAPTSYHATCGTGLASEAVTAECAQHAKDEGEHLSDFHWFPASIPSGFPRIAISGRAPGPD
jgi:hypothetical protein